MPRRRTTAQDRAVAALIVVVVAGLVGMLSELSSWIFKPSSLAIRFQRGAITSAAASALIVAFGLSLGEYTALVYAGGPAVVSVACLIAWGIEQKRSGRQRAILIQQLPQGTSATAEITADSLAALMQPLAATTNIWRVVSKQPEIWTVEIGAWYFDVRVPASVKQKRVPGIDTNAWGVYTDIGNVYFLPSFVLIEHRGVTHQSSYSDIKAEIIKHKYVEPGLIPSDAEIVGHSWQYTTSKGLPDLRYKNNRQIPVVLYGIVRLTTKQGIDICFQISRWAQADAFMTAWRTAKTAPIQSVAAQLPAPANSAGLPTVRLDTTDLIDEAKSHLKSGDHHKAHALLVQAVEAAPGNQDAWLWLSGAVNSDGERRYCMERVLEIDPSHIHARQAVIRMASVAAVSPVYKLRSA